MGQARIQGHLVNVSKKMLEDDDMQYTVSGQGAARLFAVCALHTHTTGFCLDAQSDSFTIRRSDFNNTATASSIIDGLEGAARARQHLH